MRPTSVAARSFIDLLDPAGQSWVLRRGVTKEFDKGCRLFMSGDPCERVYLIRAGIVKMSALDDDGRETTVYLCVPGDVAGDEGLVDGRPHALDATAATRGRALSLDAETLHAALRRNPAAAVDAAARLARRVRLLAGASCERNGAVPRRLAGRLLDLAGMLGRDVHGGLEVELPFPQGELAAMAGMSRETACRTLRDLRQAGVLDYRGNRLRIVRPDVLARLRCGAHAGAPFRSGAGAGPARSRSSPGA